MVGDQPADPFAAAEYSCLLGSQPGMVDGAGDPDATATSRQPGQAGEEPGRDMAQRDAGHAMRQPDPTVRSVFANVVEEAGDEDIVGRLNPLQKAENAARVGLVVRREREKGLTLRGREDGDQDGIAVRRNSWPERAESLL